MNLSACQVGVCVLPEFIPNRPRVGAYASYIHEILAHAGLFYETVEPANLSARLSQLRVLVTVGEGSFNQEVGDALRQWVNAGGAWLALNSLCEQDELLGVEAVPPTYTGPAFGTFKGTRSMGEGYLPKDNAHPILDHIQIPLHFYNGIAVQALGDAQIVAGSLDPHGGPTNLPTIVENRVGAGRTLLVAADAVGAVVRIQQGVAVTRDGVPAPDGMGPVTDGVLKCDDGIVLDWYLDREPVPGVPGINAFLQPVADQWRELILRGIFYLVQQVGATLPLLWLYPRNLPALAHISHDTDGNVLEHGEHLLALLDEAEVKTSWCVIPPGYNREFIDKVRDAGHELATHYNALDNPWSEEEFIAQMNSLKELFGEEPVSNKNHYTRWEGDTEFFDWCVRQGIQIDGTKLSSKTGDVGFPFGTCHPYFPADPAGRLIDVLEMACLTQDLEIVAPAVLAEALQAAVLRHHGVMHLLFHPGHTHKPPVHKAFVQVARNARAAGMEWWTARRLNEWERARRAVRWESPTSEKGTVKAHVSCQSELAAVDLAEATLLVLNASNLGVNGETNAAERTTRWGFEFSAITANLAGGATHELSWEAAG